MTSGDFPGSPVVKIPRFHLQGAQVQSLVSELRSHIPHGRAKKKKKKKKWLQDYRTSFLRTVWENWPLCQEKNSYVAIEWRFFRYTKKMATRCSPLPREQGKRKLVGHNEGIPFWEGCSKGAGPYQRGMSGEVDVLSRWCKACSQKSLKEQFKNIFFLAIGALKILVDPENSKFCLT